MSISPADNGVMLNKKGNKMKFFDNYKDYFDYFFFKYSSERKIRKLDNAWHGAGYYWIDSTNNINYSIADTRLENVPFSTVPKCGWMPIDGVLLPERGEKVLVSFGKIGNILMGRRMNDADGNDVWTVFFSDGERPNFGNNAEDITHWMELPSLPSVE